MNTGTLEPYPRLQPLDPRAVRSPAQPPAPRALDHPASTHAPVRFTSVARVAVRSSASPLPARLCASLHAQCAPERFTAHARGTAPVQLKSTRHSRPLADRWAKAKECPECSRLSATHGNTMTTEQMQLSCKLPSSYHVRTGPPRCAAVDKTSPTRAYRTVLAQHLKRQYRKKII